MASSLASQLQVIKSFIEVDTHQPLKKRPYTQPSVLFDPKDAADMDIDTIYDVAVSGFEVLVGGDERFRQFKNSLFSPNSREFARELVGIDEHNSINSSIKKYLQLLSGYLQLHSAMKTIEYLVRRYKVHVYNVEELILCALPYHDTHTFVRIVQLVDTGNSKWKFLDGVKASGAAPPRKIIVQQSIRDKGIVEAICTHASPTKTFQPSRKAIGFCTAVVVEALGLIPILDGDFVKKIIPFVDSGLRPGSKVEEDHRAGALMIVGVLVNKWTLSPKLTQSLMHSITNLALEDAKKSTDLQWLRISLVALIKLIQSQSIDNCPKKVLDMLVQIRDLPEVLLDLSKEFNINRFISFLLESLVNYSSESIIRSNLISMIEAFPLDCFVDGLVSKVLHSCIRLSEKVSGSAPFESGNWAKEIMVAVNKKNPRELRRAVCSFLEDSKVLKKHGSAYDILCPMLDGSIDSLAVSDLKLWFTLDHPKAEVRRTTLSGFDSLSITKIKDTDSQRLLVIQDAILHQLQDDDLSVNQAALSIDGLPDIVNRSKFVEALHNVLKKCVTILTSSQSDDDSLPCDVAHLCLKHAQSKLFGQTENLSNLATLMFPLLLIRPKTEKLNLKALDLAKQTEWPFYQHLAGEANTEAKLQRGMMSTINMVTVSCLAKTFSEHPKDYLPWLLECSSHFELSKTLFFLVMMHSLTSHNMGECQLAIFYEYCFPVMKSECKAIECKGLSFPAEKYTVDMLNLGSKEFLDQMLEGNLNELNAQIIIAVVWRLMDAISTPAAADTFLDMFAFIAASKLKSILKDQIYYLVKKSKISPVLFTSKFFTEEGASISVQVETLHCIAYLCSQPEDEISYHLLAEFPVLLIPLASEDQETRMAALKCIESLYTFWTSASDKKKNGHNEKCSPLLGKLLGEIIEQKKLISSDRNFLPLFLASLLTSSGDSILVPRDTENRFDQSTKENVLIFIASYALKLSSYGKLIILSMLKGVGVALMNVRGVEELLFDLLERSRQSHVPIESTHQKLPISETGILCLLLEIYITPAGSGKKFEERVLKAIHLESSSTYEPSIVLPCITVLKKLSSPLCSGLKSGEQERLFLDLVFLSRNANVDIQNATRDSVLRLNLTSSTIEHLLDHVSKLENALFVPSNDKRIKKSRQSQNIDISRELMSRGMNGLSFLSSLLDILLLKKDIINRNSLFEPLFELLKMLFSKEWVCEPSSQGLSGTSQAASSTVPHIQQKLMLILEDICTSLLNDTTLKGDVLKKLDVKMLLECAHSALDIDTRNHLLSLLSSIAKICPDKVLDHILDIVTVLGESAVTQLDSHSQRVFEDLIATLIPCWLSKTNDANQLLKIFVDVLPEVAEHRRLPIVVYLLRNLREQSSLAPLLVLLLKSLALRVASSAPTNKSQNSDDILSTIGSQWEYVFAVQLYQQYSCTVWLPSFVVLLQQVRNDDQCQELFRMLQLAMQFILTKLKDPEISFKLQSSEESDVIQRTLGELMEECVYLWELVDSRRNKKSELIKIRKQLKESILSVLRTITNVMEPSTYFRGIMKLLSHADPNVRRKALQLLCETIKECDASSVRRKEKKASKNKHWLLLDVTVIESYNEMCLEIVQLIDHSSDDSKTSLALKVAAVSALEALANRFPSDFSTLTKCLPSIVRLIRSDNVAVSSSCLRTAGAFVNVLGPRALSELPHVMDSIKNVSSAISPSSAADETPRMLSILVTLEAVVDKLGGFLNPYLGDIVELLVCHQGYVSALDVKLKMKAAAVRNLFTEKIDVRLALPPLMKVYSGAVASGDGSVAITFEMVANLISKMERSSVGVYHAKIFDICLLALDLRRQHPVSIQKIYDVEKNVINAMVALTMKLTETMFKPLFIKSIEWAESAVEGAREAIENIDRSISFYGLVNQLADNHRSLFVPYFKYLLQNCIGYLNDAEDAQKVSLIPKRKKAKLQEEAGINEKGDGGNHSIQKWHLRALILESLHKCFVYDNGNLKFLSSSNFELLLKPMVSQLVAEPPVGLDGHPEVPSVEEVDDILVSAVSQMALTSASDLLWKPLNHEVLMQTRSEKVRSRILGLRVVKSLLENLKEEYIQLLPETIPFLGELLEDIEQPVKSLAQEILKEMETISGESLRQYL